MDLFVNEGVRLIKKLLNADLKLPEWKTDVVLIIFEVMIGGDKQSVRFEYNLAGLLTIKLFAIIKTCFFFYSLVMFINLANTDIYGTTCSLHQW